MRKGKNISITVRKHNPFTAIAGITEIITQYSRAVSFVNLLLRADQLNPIAAVAAFKRASVPLDVARVAAVAGHGGIAKLQGVQNPDAARARHMHGTIDPRRAIRGTRITRHVRQRGLRHR